MLPVVDLLDVEDPAPRILWVVEHLEDVRSDLSVLHRVDDMESMPADRFLSFVERLAHYEGAIRHLAILAREEHNAPPTPVTRPADPAAAGDFDAMSLHPVWGQLGTFTRVPAE